MKKIIIVLIITLFLTSCHYRKNGAGYWESYSTKDYYQSGYNQNKEYGRPYRYYLVNGSHYSRNNPNGVLRLRNLHDYYYEKAIEKGVNPDWYVDRHISEGESNSND
jgi:hypothetical protein